MNDLQERINKTFLDRTALTHDKFPQGKPQKINTNATFEIQAIA